MGGQDKIVVPSLVAEGITFASTVFMQMTKSLYESHDIDVCEDVTVQIFIFYVHLYMQYNDINMKTT